MQYQFYTTSEKTWVAMLEAIKNSKKSILLESFILTDDDKTHHFFEVLKQKAADGLTVKIIVDQVGRFFFGSISKEEFKKAGAEVVYFRRWLYRTHRKILIIDEETAFLGGVNIRGEYADWLDLHIRIGGRIVKQLLKSFIKIYALAGGKDREFINTRHKIRFSKTRARIYRAKTWLMEHWPVKARSALRAYYKKKCAEARKSIVIATPYFLPHAWLLKSLRAAAKRGVKIEVILPSKTDVPIINAAHRILGRSWKSWITFLFVPEMMHAKVLLVDDKEGLIGSNNIDAQSFDFNLEASLIFKQKNMVLDLRGILNRWKKSALPIGEIEKTYKFRWYHKVLEIIIKILQPIL